jgi:hypothetical protein
VRLTTFVSIKIILQEATLKNTKKKCKHQNCVNCSECCRRKYNAYSCIWQLKPTTASSHDLLLANQKQKKMCRERKSSSITKLFAKDKMSALPVNQNKIKVSEQYPTTYSDVKDRFRNNKMVLASHNIPFPFPLVHFKK